jgi:hypothetical protein
VDASLRVITVRAGGPDDPDGSRAASLLSAYFQAEHVRAFRRLLWRRLAVVAAVFFAGATAVSFSHRSIWFGEGMVACAAVWAAVIEWRAERKLSGLISGSR